MLIETYHGRRYTSHQRDISIAINIKSIHHMMSNSPHPPLYEQMLIKVAMMNKAHFIFHLLQRDSSITIIIHPVLYNPLHTEEVILTIDLASFHLLCLHHQWQCWQDFQTLSVSRDSIATQP